MEIEQVKNRLASAASMPKDVVIGSSIVNIIGTTEMCVENFRGITEYTDKMIRLQTKNGQIKIKGCRLEIEYYITGEMRITGKVRMIEFSEGGCQI